MIKQAYGEEALGLSVVFKWHKRFTQGRDSFGRWWAYRSAKNGHLFFGFPRGPCHIKGKQTTSSSKNCLFHFHAGSAITESVERKRKIKLSL
jgi:hypothetical protein